MSVYHLTCRKAIDPSRANPPSRTAKYSGTCANPECTLKIRVGDLISCTRDNVNGKRRGTITTEGQPSDPSDDDDAEDDAAASKLSPAVRALADELVPYLEGRIARATLDRAEVERIIKECSAPAPNVTRVEIIRPDGTTADAGVQHKQFPLLVKALASGCNVWVTGPAGSGKTTAIHNAAKALSLDYRYTGSCQDQYALTGYNDATGKYVRTPCRDAYEHGGLFLWDEVDASDPNALLAFNAMLANGTAAFPDGMIERSKSCLLAATANTVGLGADAQYVGRNRLDAAFLDRWVMLDWEIDQDLELATCSNRDWAVRVQHVRHKVTSRGLKVLVTPRASYAGARLLAAGLDWETVERMALKKGMTEDQWREVSR